MAYAVATLLVRETLLSVNKDSGLLYLTLLAEIGMIEKRDEMF